MFGFIFSLLIGALAGSIAGRIMGSETSALRNIVLGILGSFVGGILFGLVGLSATGLVRKGIVSFRISYLFENRRAIRVLHSIRYGFPMFYASMDFDSLFM